MSILLKRNSVPGTIPSPQELASGEIAINTADAALYTKKENGDVVLLAYDSSLPAPVTVPWSAITGEPSSFTPSAHTHNPSDITGTAVITTDPRLSDNRDPNPHSHDWYSLDITNKPLIDNNGDNWRFVAPAQAGSVELISHSANYFVRVSEGGPAQTIGTLVKGPITILNSASTGINGSITFPDATTQTTAYTGLVAHTHPTSDITGLDSAISDIQTDISSLETNKQDAGDYSLSDHDHSYPNFLTKIGKDAAINIPSESNPDGISSMGITAVGWAACKSNTTGWQNTGIGNIALLDNTTGQANTGIGSLSLQYTTTGSWNSATGIGSARNNTTGIENSAFGAVSLYSNTTGSKNTALGHAALWNNTVGSNNIAIGYASEVFSTNYNNCIIIGSNATAYRSGDFVLGSSSNPIIVSTTVGTAGTADSLPASPLGYLEIRLNSTLVKIPYYRV